MSIDDLRNEIIGYGNYSPEYFRKQMHKVPAARTVDRVKFLLERCKGKTVLHLGCDGPLHKKIEGVAEKAYGVDQHNEHGAKNFIEMDLDNLQSDLHWPKVEVVLLAEVLEHLGNPGMLLETLKGVGDETIITVPNAFSEAGFAHMKQGYENVNRDHTCWFSYRTLKTLVERYNYAIMDWMWYGGSQRFAEGLIFAVK